MQATARHAPRKIVAPDAAVLAVDLAKDVFERASADGNCRVLARERLGRREFASCLDNRACIEVVMEACGSAHHRARRFARAGHQPVLLPAHDVRPFVRRRKTDRTDAAGLLEARRCADIRPLPVKTTGQQVVQALHRIREHYKTQRTASIKLLRGFLREFGIIIPTGAAKARPAALVALEDADNELAVDLRQALASVLDRIQADEAAMACIEQQLVEHARGDLRAQRHLAAGGIGVITATALSASCGELKRFPSGRHFASSLGLAPRVDASGHTTRLGRIIKRGDRYLRTPLVHGARAELRAAAVARTKAKPLDRTPAWALVLADKAGQNVAAIALANKTGRRLWAAEKYGERFDPNHVSPRPDRHRTTDHPKPTLPRVANLSISCPVCRSPKQTSR
jgi:transposase